MLSLIILLLEGAPLSPQAVTAPPPCAQACPDAPLRMNDIVTIGTHNSYKLAIPQDELQAIIAAAPEAIALDYSHRPLTEQLDAGARQLEIDILHDPEGGRYARPLSALATAGAAIEMSEDFRLTMSEPGFKTLHIPDIDFRSSCLTFIACLEEVRIWSDENRNHVPILLMLNAKTGAAALPGGTELLDFDAAAWDALDSEIRSVFQEDRLITPDEVRAGYATLREGVLSGGWPTLESSRGKVFFALDEGPEKVASYSLGRPSLEGRVLFVNTDEESPAAAYLTLNDPIGQQARIQSAVKRGFIVRTRSDSDTMEARAGDTSRREAAFSSGAQYISTDYLWADPRFPGYDVRLPGNIAALCNTVRLPDDCAGQIPEEITPAAVPPRSD